MGLGTWPHGVAKIPTSALLKTGISRVTLDAPVLPSGDSTPSTSLLRAAGGSKTVILPGHYVEASTHIRVSLRSCLPLDAPLPHHPFTRIVVKVPYDDVEAASALLTAIRNANASSLCLSGLEATESALRTYMLSPEQRADAELDIISGVQILDPETRVFILEGLISGSALASLAPVLPRSTLRNPEVTFPSRVYATEDLELSAIKLRDSLASLIRDRDLYVRHRVPQPAVDAVLVLDALCKSPTLRAASRSNAFLTPAHVYALNRKYGLSLQPIDMCIVPPRAADPIDHHPQDHLEEHLEGVGEEEENEVERMRRSARKGGVDHHNAAFVALLKERESRPAPDRIQEHIELFRGISEEEARARFLEGRPDVNAGEEPVYLYGGQARNYMEEQRRNLARAVRDRTDVYCTFSPGYLSGSIERYTEAEVKAAETLASKAAMLTQHGFRPSPKTRSEDLKHPLHPHPSRVEELAEPWEAPTPLYKLLKPEEEKREAHKPGFHVPPKLDGSLIPGPPPSVHYAGDAREKEEEENKRRAREEWEAKLVVDDPVFRLATPDPKRLPGESLADYRKRVSSGEGNETTPRFLNSTLPYDDPEMFSFRDLAATRRVGGDFDVFAQPERSFVATRPIPPLQVGEKARWFQGPGHE